MTTRPGQGPVELLRLTRGKRIATAIALTRLDGFVLRFTDHDSRLTVEGDQYEPLIGAGMSAERREAGFRSGNQEAYGNVDGAVIQIPDFLGNLYRGAEVRQLLLDWSMPWQVFARHRKWVRSVSWTGSTWVATLEGRTQQLQRPAGGRFGGVWPQVCPYVLGGPFCKKDVSIGSGFAGAGARVQTVVNSRLVAQFAISTWAGAYADDFFRDGEIEWLWSAPVDTGTNTATTTTSTLTDTAKTWATDEHVGKVARILNTAGGYVQGVSYSTITSNAAHVLTFASKTAMTGFGAGTPYDICGVSANVGTVSPIVGYTQATRQCTFLLPTPFPISVGDGGIFRAGCDGLFDTCKSKFANQLNHGGDPNSPSTLDLISPP